MELWEYNAYMAGYEKRHKQHEIDSILTGYYCAYYLNGGQKAKPPSDLIKKLYIGRQSFDEGIKAIERVKAIDRRNKNE